MAGVSCTPGNAKYAVLRICERVSSRQLLRRDWRRLSETKLWHELASCILGSQVTHECAAAALRLLRSERLLDLQDLLCRPREVESETAAALSRPMLVEGIPRTIRFRFPALRARQLRLTAERIYLGGGSLRSMLRASNTPAAARACVAVVASGVGPKQASLFLRNIGYAEDIAVLDTHVLRYMELVQLVPCLPQISRLSGYEQLECVLRMHAQELGFPLSCLDLAIWVVMRVLPRGW
jgi:N-glycosylase/DNA lyase